MTLLNVQVNRGLDGKFRKPIELLEGFRDLYLQGMADQLVLNSPVDTGTYITAHNIGTSQVPATESSEGKPRQQPYEAFAQAARNGLFLDIRMLPENTNSVVFYNAAFHSDEVEYEHGYAPYRKTAREHSRIASQAEAEARARNK